jgi:catechol 2,3-dioxygenase-like lactoylglutathione lyase family enzyme
MAGLDHARWPETDLATVHVFHDFESMRLNQVTVPARDLAQSIDFYSLLGLKLIVRNDHYARFEFPDGESTFSLHLAEGEIARANAPQIYFECDDLAGQVARLKAAGVAFETEVTHQSWLWTEAWLRDPAGNSLCLFYAGENRRYPPWRIG